MNKECNKQFQFGCFRDCLPLMLRNDTKVDCSIGVDGITNKSKHCFLIFNTNC